MPWIEGNHDCQWYLTSTVGGKVYFDKYGTNSVRQADLLCRYYFLEYRVFRTIKRMSQTSATGKAILAGTLLLTLAFASRPYPSHTADTSGCGRPHAPGYHDADDTNSLESGGLTRQYGIYIPQSYNDNPNKPRKLILDYHGNNGTPLNQYNNSRYFDYPNGEEYLAVYPAGVDQSFQSAPYAAEGVDDLQFTTDLLAHLRQKYCVDSDHVYASGKSNGGGFVDFLACSENGDEFAAFAMASAALYSDNGVEQCNNTRARAVLESHGMNDTTISYYGGPRNGATLPDIQSWIGWWAQRDGCKAGCEDCRDVQQHSGYEVISYDCGGLQDVVQHYEVFDLGHCWPSSTGDNSDSARAYCGDRSLDFTPVVLDFFSRWSLRSISGKWQEWET